MRAGCSHSSFLSSLPLARPPVSIRSAFVALAICLSLFIILFMVLVPKEPPGGSTDPAVYDHTAGFRKAAAGILGVAAVITLIVVIGQVLVQPIQGSRIRNA